MKMMEVVKTKGKDFKIGLDKLCGFLMMLPVIVMYKFATVYANEWDFLTDGSVQGQKGLDKITKTVKSSSKSIYEAVLAGGVAAMIIGAIFLGVGIALTKNSTKKSENKSQLLWFIIGGIVFFGGGVILGFAKNIADGLAATP